MKVKINKQFTIDNFKTLINKSNFLNELTLTLYPC